MTATCTHPVWVARGSFLTRECGAPARKVVDGVPLCAHHVEVEARSGINRRSAIQSLRWWADV